MAVVETEVGNEALAVTIREETYADVIDEIKPLLLAHYEEIASFKEAIPLDPDYGVYADMHRDGNIFILAARRGGRLVGYSIFFLVNHPHYRSTLFAMSDILYVDPSERGGRLGFRLIKDSEACAARRGARLISWHIKPVNDFSPALERLGYVRHEIFMAKLLEE